MSSLYFLMLLQDLAIKTIDELWFSLSLAMNGSTLARATSPKVAQAPQNKAHYLVTVAVIMGVSNNFKQNQAPLEDTLHKIVSSAEGANETRLPAAYGELCDTLIEGLVDASDFPGFVSFWRGLFFEQDTVILIFCRLCLTASGPFIYLQPPIRRSYQAPKRRLFCHI